MNREKINVCHIITGDLWAGAEVQAYALIVGLSEVKDINLNVITFNNGILFEKLISSDIRVDIIPETFNTFYKMIWYIYTILKSTGAEVVHTHGYKETFLGGLATKFSNVKLLVRTHHGKAVLSSRLKHRFIEKLNAIFLTDKEIAVSEDLKSILKSKKHKEKNISVIHNGINTKEIKPTKSTAEIRHELELPHEAFVIGTVGRLVKVKGHKYFLDGAEKILNRNSNIMFLIAGDGPLMYETQTEIKRKGLENSVKLLGFRNDVFDILNIFDIFVMTSLHEGIPLVLLEAMCMAKPVIATRVGGIPEIISDHKNGLLIPPMNPQAFADACLELIKNRSLRENLATNAKRDCKERFGIERVVEGVEKLYRDIS